MINEDKMAKAIGEFTDLLNTMQGEEVTEFLGLVAMICLIKLPAEEAKDAD